MNKGIKEETLEKITLTVNTANYIESVGVSVKAFMLAEQMDHHPVVTTAYNQVKIEISTHSAGDTVTEKDRHYVERLTALL